MSKNNSYILNNRNPGLTRIRDLWDVDITSISNGSTLTWNSSSLIWEALPAGSYNADVIQFNTSYTPASEPEGQMWWSGDDFTMNMSTGSGPVLQVGQETYVIVYNNSGSQIDNGKVVKPVYVYNGRPTIELADAITHEGLAGGELWMATMDIPHGDYGIVTKYGKVRGLNTSTLTVGLPLYLSTTPGGVTNTKPEFPNYQIWIGATTVVDASNGEILFESHGRPQETTENFYNGMFREPSKFTVTSDGATITGTFEPADSHDDMTMMFSDGFSMLDTNPAVEVTLTAGTDTSPQINYVYVPKSTKVVTVSTAGWPITEHIKIATVYAKTAATTNTDGIYEVQYWSDEIQGIDDNTGHLSHISHRLRLEHAIWMSGTEGTCTISGTPDDVLIDVTAGIVNKIHDDVFNDMDMATGDKIHVINHSTTPHVAVTNLNTQTADALGNTLVNTSFSFVVWGIANCGNNDQQLAVNLPIGSYAYNKPEDAAADIYGYSVYDIPTEFRGIGFLIARFTLQLDNSSNWTLYETQDLRGKTPNATAGTGAGASGITTFLGLTDTPNSYSSQGLNLLRVNVGETSVEFTDTNTLVMGEMGNVLEDPTGFPKDLSDAIPSFDDGTLTFTLTPVGSFSFYSNGVLYTKSTPQTKTIANTTGLHIIYFDSSGVMQETTDIVGNFFSGNAFVAAVYWNATAGKSVIVHEERHGYHMGTYEHFYFHVYFGTQYRSGLALNNMTVDGNGSSDTHAQFGIDDGIVADEDLDSNITNGSPQTISPILNAPVLYLEGASSIWNKDVATTFALKMGATYPNYNQYTGGAWQQTELNSGDFVLAHVFASYEINNPIFVVQGQDVYSNKTNARAGAATEMNNLILTGLPTPEFIPVASIIFEAKSTFSNAVKSRIVSTASGEDYVNWLGQSLSPTTTPAAHNNLSGRDAAEAHPASAIVVNSTGFGGNLSVSDIDVQTALDTLDGVVPGGAGSDTTAIHDDTAGEISAIAAKTSFSADDLLLIEDSDDTYNKKKIAFDSMYVFSNIQVDLDNTMSTAEIQAAIDAVPRCILNGAVVTFQFADGSYTLTDTLSFSGFYGGGQISILGNATDNTLSTTKSVHLDFSGQSCTGLFFPASPIQFYVRYIKLTFDTATDNNYGIQSIYNAYVHSEFNYILGTSASYGYGFGSVRTSSALCRSCYFSNMSYSQVFNGTGAGVSSTNDDTGTQPDYGIFATNGSSVGKVGTQVTGATADEYTTAGGVVRT